MNDKEIDGFECDGCNIWVDDLNTKGSFVAMVIDQEEGYTLCPACTKAVKGRMMPAIFAVINGN